MARASFARSPEITPSAYSAAVAGFFALAATTGASVPEGRVELLEQADGGLADHRAGREDRRCAGFRERVEVLRRDHAADHDHDVLAAEVLQFGLEFGNERQVSGGERARADD